ncbi:dihydrofolate reductase [bacterium]|nr:dihydrofolate reductase [bacterium]
MKLRAIVCAAANGVIGNAGALPWNVPEDMRHFKELTMGHALIVGRKSYMGPLAGRKLVVLSRKGFSAPEGIEIAKTKEEALKIALSADPEPFVIGGAEVYKMFEPEISDIYLTRLNKEFEGDTLFPISLDSWEKISERAFSEGTFETWVKGQRMR